MILADFAVKSALLLTLAFVVVGLMRRASAASRHAVWTATFGAIVLLPLATIALPSLPLRVLPADQPAPTLIAPPAIPFTTARVDVPHSLSPRATDGASPTARAMAPARAARSTGAWTPDRTVTVVWLLGCIVMLARIAAGTLAVRRLAGRTRCADSPRLLSKIESAATSLGVRRPIVTLIAAADAMPATWGTFRPTLLLPSSSEDWPDARLNAVLVHELAHVARWDSLSQAVARLAVALLWFNPLVWAAAGRARLERERACDDRVIASGTRASEYAHQLLALMSLVKPAGSLTSLAMARRSHLAARLSAILDPNVNRRGPSRATLARAVGFIMVTLPLAAARPAGRLTEQSVTPSIGDMPGHVDLALPATATDQQATPTKPAPEAAPSQASAPQHLDVSSPWKGRRGSGEVSYFLPIRTPDGRPYVAPGLYDGHGKEFYFFNYLPAPTPRPRIDGTTGKSPTFLHPKSPAGTWTLPAEQSAEAPTVDVIVNGEVRRPGTADTKQPLALSAAIAQVGGFTAGAEVIEIRRRSSGAGSVTAATPANEYRIQYVIRANLESHTETDPVLKGGEFVLVRQGLYLHAPPGRGFGAGALRLDWTTWGVAAPVVLTSREPQYTAAGMAAKLQGIVDVEVVVSADGTVREARVVTGLDWLLADLVADLKHRSDPHSLAVLEVIGNGPLGLDANAVECVKTWTFTPGTVLGEPHAMIQTVSVEFKLR